MSTVTEVTAQPTSGLNHIDALLDTGPGWNWLAPARNTLVYSFDVTPANSNDVAKLSSGVSMFNAAQQAAVVSALAYISGITGITFVANAESNNADLHFGAANITSTTTTGLCSWDFSYIYSNVDTITSYRADAWIYLDNAEYASMNAAPGVGTAGYELLLHELGHALGLKHSFEGRVTLPAAQDSTAYTLMSYTSVGGPYSSYSPYDVAALTYLYGGDGLGGALGVATSALFLVGTTLDDVLGGGAGNDVFEGGTGSDSINGGAGVDTARFTGQRAEYTVSTVDGGFRIAGPDGSDTLQSIEKARFADQTITLQAANIPPSGAITLVGSAQQGAAITLVSTLADVDGLGALSYRWQSSANALTWSDVAGATASSLVPGEPQVGQQLRVLVSYVDGGGTAEAVTSASSLAVLGVRSGTAGNDVLTGSAFADLINGLDGNDRLAGRGGNDSLSGGAGLDAAVFDLNRANYEVAPKAVSVRALGGNEGSDTLSQIERLQFADQSLAFDLSGAAGVTARILGAVFGKASIANQAYAGIGLRLLDAGTTPDALMQLALEARLGANWSAAAEVQLLYQNLLGVNPSAGDLAYWTDGVAGGQYTLVSLATLAAGLELNAQNINLVGLADQGLAFTLG